MASITIEERNELTAMIIGMFDAVPGSVVLSVSSTAPTPLSWCGVTGLQGLGDASAGEFYVY